MQDKTLLWLRDELKPLERRTLLTPALAGELIEYGHPVVVERSTQRVFPIEEYVALGCTVAESGAWQHQAPADALILGLKELPAGIGPLRHEHVHFAHAYKYQQGWKDYLQAFANGGGQLYDLEYLTDGQGRRVAAFGYWAGFAGAAVALLAWAGQQSGARPVLQSLQPWSSRDAAIHTVVQDLSNVTGQPHVLIIGALGRCGQGALDLCQACGVEPLAWDVAETAAGGPFDAILDQDILINTVFVADPVPAFTTREHLASRPRRLTLINDVSCDPFGPANPLPIYSRCTDLEQPVMDLDIGTKPLQLIAIDHLPTLLPRKSSEDFANQLRATLLDIEHRDSGAWARSLRLFQQRLHEATEPTDTQA